MALRFPLDPTVVPLTDAATITTDASQGGLFTVTLASSRNMGVPTNPKDGQKILYKIKQGGTGSYSITWSNAAGGFQFTTSSPAPTLSTAVGAYDYVGFIYDSTSNKWNYIGASLGFV